jgi:thiol reductant ABC exporter CydD subunit
MGVAVGCGLVVTATVVAQALLIATVVDRVMLGGESLGQVTPLLIGLGVAFVVRAAFGWLAEVSGHRCGAMVTSTLRARLLRRSLELGPEWLAGERVGELSTTATRGTAALSLYFSRYVPQAVLAVVAPVVLVIWVATRDWLSALLLAALLALVPVAMIVFGRRAAERGRRQWRLLSSLAAHLLELIEGLDILRAFGRQSQGRREVAEATDRLRMTTMDTLRVSFLSAFAMELLSGLGVGLVAMVLGLRLLNGSVAFTTAFAVLLVAPEAFLALRRAGAEFHASTEGQAAADRIIAVIDQPGPPVPPSRPGATAPSPGTHPLVVRGLTVRYPSRSTPAVEGVSVHLEPGAHLALRGPSGVGKSTVLAALLRFTASDEGAIECGGVDLRTVDPDLWRRHIGWVPQRPRLLRATLADNVRLGRPNAASADLYDALAMVGLDHWVRALPGGLDTMLGDDGLTLSAGERQRVALARVVVRDPPLVLLDEPTEHLDDQSETELGARFGPWLDGRTLVVAAHRSVSWCRVDAELELTTTPSTTLGAGRH